MIWVMGVPQWLGDMGHEGVVTLLRKQILSVEDSCNCRRMPFLMLECVLYMGVC